MIDEKDRIDLTALSTTEKRRLNDSILKVLLVLTADGRQKRDTFTITRYAYFSDDSPVRELVEEHLFERGVVTDGYSIDHKRHAASIVTRSLRKMSNIESHHHEVEEVYWEIASATKAVVRIFGKRRIKEQVRRVALRHVINVSNSDRFNINAARNSACRDKSMLSIVDRIPTYLDASKPRSDVARHMFSTRMAQDGLRMLEAEGIIRAAREDDHSYKIDAILEAMARTYADDGDLIGDSDDEITL